jgi:hypothetical protein
METSPIREQTAFMSALTKLRTKFEADMAALYASQREYKEAYSLVETVKSFGFGDLDYLELSIIHGNDLQMYVDLQYKDLETLYKALKITGLNYATWTSPPGNVLIIDVPGYSRLNFIAPVVVESQAAT